MAETAIGEAQATPDPEVVDVVGCDELDDVGFVDGVVVVAGVVVVVVVSSSSQLSHMVQGLLHRSWSHMHVVTLPPCYILSYI